MRERYAARVLPRVLLLTAATAAVLGAATPAGAAITGTVTTSGGDPLPGVDVRVQDAQGANAGSSTQTSATGAFSIEPSYRSATPPFTVRVRMSDRCGGPSLETTAPATGDGAALAPLLLDPRPFCAVSSYLSGGGETTGLALPDERLVLAGPGGRVHINTTVPYTASDIAVTLADGTVVGTAASRNDSIAVTAPTARYDGPLTLRFTYEGAVATRVLGTLRSGSPPASPAVGGAFDLAAIVDVSGSMSGADPGYRRKDAVSLLIDLASPGDRLVGTAFDSEFHDIFGRTTVTTAAKAQLKRLANRRIVNAGGTDYDVGFAEAYKALTGDPLRPATPKGAIFLTDGAHNGAYDNTHLRFAFNPSTRGWPICVVQLGSAFSAGDTARLRRIAEETGGAYVKTPSNTELENLYFQCQGRTAGAKTLLRKAADFRVGQTRSYRQRVAKGQRKATFFVSYVAGRYQLSLTQPGGRTYRKTTGKKVRLVRSRTFSFFEVHQPKPGSWRLAVRRLKTGGRTDRATTTITVQRRGGKARKQQR